MAKQVTKRQAAIGRAENWKQALREHRVVNFFNGMTLKAFKTPDEAQAAAAEVDGAFVVTSFKG